MLRLLTFLIGLAIASSAWAQQPTTAPSHQYFSGPSLGMVYTGQCVASGATPQTCNAMRGIATTNSLSTAALTAATYVVNNSFVTASSVVQCSINSYSGTYVTNGDPLVAMCVPGAGTITFTIFNAHATNALAGTLGLAFEVVD